MNTNQQINLFRSGQPDEEAIRLLRSYESFALKFDPRGYCVCTSEGKDSRVLGHLMRRAGVRHFYIHNITGIDPPELVYFQRRNFQQYADDGYEAHLEQCSLYQEGFDRLWCIGCPMAGETGRRREIERWPGFRRLWLRAFRSCIDGRREAGLPILDNGKTAEEWMEWWLSDAAMDAPVDEDQMLIGGYDGQKNP